MQTVLFLIVLASVAYVLAHYVVERLQARFLVTSGVEYLILGLLIGPVMPWGTAIPQETLTSLHPVMSLVLGGLGLYFGLQANFRQLLLREDDAVPLAATEFITTLTMVGLGAWTLMQTEIGGGFGRREAAAGAWVLAASAAVSSNDAMAVIKRRFGASGKLTNLLEGTMQTAELLAIPAFGVVFCVFHTADMEHTSWNYANWLLVTLGLGLGLGVLFRLFIGEENEDEDHVFLAILGIIVFASGAAYYLKLSPMLVTLVLGATLANITSSGQAIARTIERLHRPVSIMLLVLAGALWRPIPLSAYIVVVTYVGLRMLAKAIGGLAGAASSGDRLPRDIGRGLLGHGDVAVAMVVGYTIVFDGPVVDLVFTCVLASVLVSELTAARQLKSLLIDGGDIQREDPGPPPVVTRGEPQQDPSTTPKGA